MLIFVYYEFKVYFEIHFMNSLIPVRDRGSLQNSPHTDSKTNIRVGTYVVTKMLKVLHLSAEILHEIN